MTISPTTKTCFPPRRRALGPALGLAALMLATPALAAPPVKPAAPQVSEDGTRIAAPIAAFSGLDKITGRIISFDVAIDETVQFGALQVTPRVCYSRPPTVAPLTTSFVEVDEITLDNKIRRIFTGWMYADSPGLHAVEHAVYDIWLTDCRSSSSDAAATARAGLPAAPAGDAAEKPATPVEKPAPAAPKPAAQVPAPAAPAPGGLLPSRSELPPLR